MAHELPRLVAQFQHSRQRRPIPSRLTGRSPESRTSADESPVPETERSARGP